MIPISSFIETVKKHFFFLIDEYDYSIKKIVDNRLVRYETKKVFVEISYESYSHEIDLSIGLLTYEFENERPFNLYEVKQLVLSENDSFPNYQVSTIVEMKKCLGEISSLFKKNCTQLLKGDIETFNNLAKKRSQNHVRLEDGWKRSSIKIAWEKKDYAKVIELLGSFENLSKAEQKKLDFARKRLGEG